MAAKNSQLKSCNESRVTVERLRQRADFLKARNGARSHERAFVLQLKQRDINENADASSPLRVGLTVTKKVGNAVERNRIKRRLREAIKQADLTDICSGKDAVFVARREALTEPFDALVASISNSLVNAKTKAKSSSRKRNRNTDPKT